MRAIALVAPCGILLLACVVGAGGDCSADDGGDSAAATRIVELEKRVAERDKAITQLRNELEKEQTAWAHGFGVWQTGGSENRHSVEVVNLQQQLAKKADEWARLEKKLRALIASSAGDPREAEVARAKAEARAEAVEATWAALLPRLTREANEARRVRDGMHGALRAAGPAVVPTLVDEVQRVRGTAPWVFPLLGEMRAGAREAIPLLERLEKHGDATLDVVKLAIAALGKIRSAVAAEKK